MAGAEAARATDLRNPDIDLLRGLSILLVVLHHIGLRIPLTHGILAEYVPRFVLGALNYNGYEAVFMFFVISGFLITRNTLRRYGSLGQMDARDFYARRFARIVPCLVVLLLVLSALHRLGVEGYVIHRAGQSLPRALSAALGLHLNWYEGHYGYLPANWDVLWSLSIEEMFYLAFPIACLMIRRTSVLLVLLTVCALTLPWSHAALKDNEIWQEKAYLPGMAAIAIGVVGAMLADRWPLHGAWSRRAWRLAGGAGIVAVLFAGAWIWSLLRDGYLLMLTISVMVLLVSSRGGHAQAWRGLRWLCSFGRLSYEIYLSHMFVVLTAVRVFHAYGSNMKWGVLWYAPTVFACWLLGLGVDRLLSTPCERWLRFRLMKRPPSGLPIMPPHPASE
ncbi:acyltransferase [Dyella monticola]|uniref:Acyltransferase n=1 Tax=Dyella monticola TaxID=1927958 RepID=A0A370X450_9GAMM|nr:acyltransferase [Dyella monticola]RDS82995.1 acyltransferase [Dyella monticola]